MKRKEDYQKDIFGLVFQLSNATQTYMDRILLDSGVTTKQFMLMIVVDTFKEAHPTFSEVAKVFMSSHQNVKQIALKLEEKGFLNIIQDEKDRRIKRLHLTKKAYRFWENRDQEDQQRMEVIFQDIELETLKHMFIGMNQLKENIRS